MTTSIYNKRLVLFTGKGGVGKTSVAAAFALSCANKGMKTLLMQVNAKDRVGSMFGIDIIGEDVIKVEDNFFAVNATPQSAMREYALMTLRVKVIYRAVFENKIVRAFLRAIPGINELVLLGKAYFHAAVEEEKGELKWDIVVLDAPATGHGIYLLQIPSVITSILSSGQMREEAGDMLELLQDPKRTSLNIVTLAEDLPVNEAAMLFNTAKETLDIPVDNVIVNRLFDSPFSDADIDILDDIDQSDEMLTALSEAARFRHQRYKLQHGYLDKLETQVPLPQVRLPFVFRQRFDREALVQLSSIIEKELT